MSRKKENTRIVTFEADYKLKNGKVVYKKGTTHAIHKSTVEKIKEKGAKCSVKTLDEFQKEQKAKEAKKK